MQFKFSSVFRWTVPKPYTPPRQICCRLEWPFVFFQWTPSTVSVIISTSHWSIPTTISWASALVARCCVMTSAWAMMAFTSATTNHIQCTIHCVTVAANHNASQMYVLSKFMNHFVLKKYICYRVGCISGRINVQNNSDEIIQKTIGYLSTKVIFNFLSGV